MPKKGSASAEEMSALNSIVDKHTEIEPKPLMEFYGDSQIESGDTPEVRWNYLTAYVLDSFSKIMAHYYASNVLSDETRKLRTTLTSYLRKSDCWSQIEQSTEMQQVFMLGYSHALSTLFDLAQDNSMSKEDEPLITAVHTYKHITPCVMALEANHQLSHAALAEQVQISASALSNFMSRVSSYDLFDTVVAGRYRYYRLSQPNGHRMASLIKKSHVPNIENQTEILSSILDNLIKISRDEISQNELMEDCQQLVRHKTTAPNILLWKIDQLSLLLNSPRYPSAEVSERAKQAEDRIIIYTVDITGEKEFASEIMHNIKRGIDYCYVVLKENKERSNKNRLKDCLSSYLKRPEDKEAFRKQIKFSYIDNLRFEISDTSEPMSFSTVFILDGNEVFLSEDKNINEKTLYMKPGEEIEERIIDSVNCAIKRVRKVA